MHGQPQPHVRAYPLGYPLPREVFRCHRQRGIGVRSHKPTRRRCVESHAHVPVSLSFECGGRFGSAALCAVAATRLDGQEEFRFRSAIELINVTATVTDVSGHFVSGLEQSDFLVYEDDRPVDITHFSAERVPVSLGIVLDTSGSMAGEKIDTARSAIERFLDQLPNPEDEVFLYQFADDVDLLQDWTADRATSRRSAQVRPCQWRNRHVRRGDGSGSQGPGWEAPKKSDPAHFGWRRHQQPRRFPRGSRCCARNGSPDLRGGHRRP